MPKIKQEVILIHGINTAGEWQAVVEEVLAPHFCCVPVKYHDYRRFGAVKQLLGPWSGVALTLWIAGMFVFGLGGIGWAWCVAIVLMVLTLLEAFVRRRISWNRVKRQLDSECSIGLRPHLISHSFGTWLTGRILRVFPDALCDKIILIGSVLPTRYDWKGILEAKPRPRAFEQVRNEIGKKDLVVWIAGLLEWIPGVGFGHAGVKGFKSVGDGEPVHTLSNAMVPCVECESQRAAIHNVPLREFMHSTAFLTKRHAELLWLPFLFNVDPGEYREMLELCELATALEESGDEAQLAHLELAIHERQWRWLRAIGFGKTFEDYVAFRAYKRLEESGSEPETELKEVVDLVIRYFWIVVAEALAERRKPRENQNDLLLLSLRPVTAVTVALSHVLTRCS